MAEVVDDVSATTEGTSEAPENVRVEEEAAAASAVKPSKSNLIDGRAASMSRQSRVTLVEPGQEASAPREQQGEEGGEGGRRTDSEADRRPSEAERRRSEAERRRSETERRRSEAERRRSESGRLLTEGSRQHVRSSQANVGGRGSVPGSLRSSLRTSMEASREGITRRPSDRPSRARAAVGSTISVTRISGYTEYLGGMKAVKYMNSYKLDSDNPFKIEKVEKILKEVMTNLLENMTYDPDICPKQAKLASNTIRSKVKEQEYDRYKLVCLVTIGEKKYQDLCSVVRFLWDIDRDKYALFVHENMHVYAAAMCFGIYYE